MILPQHLAILFGYDAIELFFSSPFGAICSDCVTHACSIRCKVFGASDGSVSVGEDRTRLYFAGSIP